MLKRVSLAVLFAVALGGVYPTMARQSDTFLVYGAGAAPCTSWTEHLTDKASHSSDAQWVFGFASAAGVFAGVQLKADVNAFEPFVTKYCQEHPTATITTAAANLVGMLR